MPFDKLTIVPVDLIPEGPYETPRSDLMRVYGAAKAMEEICKSNDGMGLAASQVGLPWRMFIVWANYPDSDVKFDCLFDCSYEPVGDGVFSSLEGCLSLPGERYTVERHESVRVSGFRLVEHPEGVCYDSFESVFSGAMAVLLQHEIDHDMGRSRMIDAIGLKVRPA